MQLFLLQFFACFAKLQSNMDLDESTKYRCLRLYLNFFSISIFWRRIHGGYTFLMPMCRDKLGLAQVFVLNTPTFVISRNELHYYVLLFLMALLEKCNPQWLCCILFCGKHTNACVFLQENQRWFKLLPRTMWCYSERCQCRSWTLGFSSEAVPVCVQ